MPYIGETSLLKSHGDYKDGRTIKKNNWRDVAAKVYPATGIENRTPGRPQRRACVYLDCGRVLITLLL